MAFVENPERVRFCEPTTRTLHAGSFERLVSPPATPTCNYTTQHQMSHTSTTEKKCYIPWATNVTSNNRHIIFVLFDYNAWHFLAGWNDLLV